MDAEWLLLPILIPFVITTIITITISIIITISPGCLEAKDHGSPFQNFDSATSDVASPRLPVNSNSAQLCYRATQLAETLPQDCKRDCATGIRGMKNPG